MAEKCHICMEPITINMLYSNAFRYNYESRSYSFHHICLEDLTNTKNENKSLKLELNCMKEVYNALIQRHSIVEESRDWNAKECKEKEMKIKELMIFKQEIESVTKQQSERIQTLKNELKVLKGDFFN